MPEYTLLPLDCRQAMRLCMPPESVDSVVTDPPYDLTSIVKRFGAPNATPAQYGTDGVFQRSSKGFMNQLWDGTAVAFDPDTWREVWRVLKPGGHLFAFGGTRTYHRMVCAIEDAGFEIRDQFGWAYGSGFPKSHDVSKAIDRMAGAEREIVGFDEHKSKQQTAKIGTQAFGDYQGSSGHITAPATPEAQRWQGWGTAVKPAWEPIVLARKPLIGSVARNVLAHGTGALNIDACRIDFAGKGDAASASPVGIATGKPLSRLSDVDDERASFVPSDNSAGRWPANLCHDGSDEVLACFPDTKARGNRGASLGRGANDEDVYAGGGKDLDCGESYNHDPVGSISSAARFFYCGKASKTDRDEGCEHLAEQDAGMRNGSGRHLTRAYDDASPRRANIHPTVKPTALMEWLVRLVTPPGGLVLDPFTGSGSTGKAALRQGFSFVGCEMTPEYIPIAEARLAHALAYYESLRP